MTQIKSRRKLPSETCRLQRIKMFVACQRGDSMMQITVVITGLSGSTVQLFSGLSLLLSYVIE